MSRMSRVIVAAGGVAAALVISVAAHQRPDAAAKKMTGQDTTSGWIQLFDGKSLDAWRGYKREDAGGTRWRIDNGTLTLPPSDGSDTRGARDIITKETFERFELTWEWRASP